MYYTPEKFIAILLSTSVIAYLYCLIIIFTYKNFGGLDKSFNKSQTAHSNSTPRFGGIALLFSILTVEIIFGGIFRTWFLWALLPIFSIGLVEDFHIETKPIIRILVGIFSSCLAIYLSKSWLVDVDFPLFNKILDITIFGLAFTIFASVGLINAINLIDGIHGLAAAKTVIISIGIFLVASKVGEDGIAAMGALVAAASLGLFFISYPFGRIFMGDAGAYTIGFIIAWQLIILLSRHQELSAWSLLAIVFWPVMDTIFSIFRRLFKGSSANKPDLLHFHQLIMRFLEIISRKKISRLISNPLATAIILPFACIPVIFGIKFSHNVLVGLLVVIISTFFYLLSYYGIIIILRRQKLRRKISHLTSPIWIKIVH